MQANELVHVSAHKLTREKIILTHVDDSLLRRDDRAT